MQNTVTNIVDLLNYEKGESPVISSLLGDSLSHYNSISIRFWLRANAAASPNDVPVYCQVRVNGERTNDFSIGVSVPKSHWSQKHQEVQNHPLANELNNLIFKQKRLILLLKDNLESSGEKVTADSIRIAYLKMKKSKRETAKGDKKKNKKQRFLAILSWYRLQKINNGIAINTAKNYKSWLNNWQLFLRYSGNMGILCDSVSYQIIEEFKTYFTQKGISETHISRHLSFAQEALGMAVMKSIIPNNPIHQLTLSFPSNFDPEGLEIEQIKKLFSFSDFTEREQSVVLAFLFMCSTGMDYCDYAPLDWSIEFSDGKYWVSYPRQKNQHRKNQPNAEPFVLSFGVEIWKLFGKDVTKFPVTSLTEMNRVLKEVSRKAGINFKKLTSKRARKTYANICANDLCLSDESITYLLGHTTTKHLRAYRKVKRKRVLSEMSNNPQFNYSLNLI